jgi:hypothetical protein
VARLTWALILVMVFAAPDLAAKAGKKPKAAKAVKETKEAKETANVVSFTNARPENAGMMNGVPARIALEPRDGILSSRLTHLGQEKAPGKDRGFVLAGGDTLELSVRPGTYSVQALTPVEVQPPSIYGRKRRQWESPVVKVLLARGDVITLVVEPGVTGADYDGTWHIGKAAPPEPAEPEGDAAAVPRDQ